MGFLMGDVKLPPHSIEAEQAVIGGLMIRPKAWMDVADIVAASDFYRADHQMIFGAIAEILETGTEADVITLAEKLDGAGNLQRCGGMQYLGDLQNETPSAANVVAYARIVRDKAQRRELIKAGSQIVSDAYGDGDREITDLLDEAQRTVLAIGEEDDKEKLSSMSDVWQDYLPELKARSELDGALRGITTGFNDLDQLTGGLQKKDLILVAGRPSMGKTVFAQNLLEACAIGGKGRALFFSMEMGRLEVMDRIVSNQANVDLNSIRTALLSEPQWTGIVSAMQRTKDSGLWIDERANLSVPQIRATARRAHRRFGLDLIVIDYLQLMRITNPQAKRYEGLGDITRGLKSLAKELDVPVVLLSQLNRGVEQRPNKRPVMSDLKESGDIEQDADVILMLYRGEYYDSSDQPGVAEVIIRKQRQGQLGTVQLMNQFHRMRFSDFDPMLAQEYASAAPEPKRPEKRAFD